MAYRNKKTGQVISDAEYSQLKGSSTAPAQQSSLRSTYRMNTLKAESAQAEQEASKSVGRRFLGELPGQAAKTLLQTPAKFAYSGASAPLDIGRGALGMKPQSAELPFVGRTLQGDAQQRMDNGASPLATVGRAAVEVPLAGLETLGVGQAVGKAGSMFAARAERRAMEDAIELFSPELKGKRGLKLLIDRAKRGDELFGEDKNAIEYAKKFAGIVKGKNVGKNIESLQSEFEVTKDALTTALAKDQTLTKFSEGVKRLSGLKKAKTREIKISGDESSKYDDVIDFALETLKKHRISTTQLDSQGIYNARVAFDQEARRVYERAYAPGGYIDTKTSAGRAIKDVRDALNTFLYNSTPHGSALQSLVKREADIFNAYNILAPKALKAHGLTFLQRHPIIRTGVKVIKVAGEVGAVGVGGYGLSRFLSSQ